MHQIMVWGVLSLPDLLLPSPDGAGETARDTRAQGLLHLVQFEVLHVIALKSLVVECFSQAKRITGRTAPC